MIIPSGSVIVMLISAIGLILSSAVFLLVLWQAPRQRDNQLVALYMLTIIVWSASAFMARFLDLLSLPIAPAVYVITLSLGANTLMLFVVATYLSKLGSKPVIIGIIVAATAYMIFITYTIFSGQMVSNISITPDGQMLTTLSPLTYVSSFLFFGLSMSALLLFWRNRKQSSSSFLYAGIGAFLGMLTSLFPPLTRFGIPILCGTVSSLFFARAILQENLFNPLLELNRKLEKANLDLQHASQLKSQFLATMSHELRTPLNAIMGFSDLILMGLAGEITDKTRHSIERIAENSQRLLNLIDDVLDISRIEAGRVDLSRDVINPAELLAQAEDALRVKAEEKKLELITILDPNLPATLEGDRKRLDQILLNLGSNALKFTHEGTITLELARKGEHEWRIIVKDTGIGIAPHDQEIIFQKFRQADGTPRRAYGGTGLGLAIVKELALMMGGNVKVNSKTEQGSTFIVSLPLVAYGEREKA